LILFSVDKTALMVPSPLAAEGDRRPDEGLHRSGHETARPLFRKVRGNICAAFTLFAPLALAACQQHNAYPAGTPEYAASVVSRGYDCNLRVERGRVVAVYSGDERQRFVATNQQLAVRSYNLPRPCSQAERTSISAELRSIARR
jgi:hypothetical protein